MPLKIFIKNLNINKMAYYAAYPSNQYKSNIPLWVNFYVAPYDVRAAYRTRWGISSRKFGHIRLPLPSEPGFQARHEFAQADNPVGPVISMAGLLNSGNNMDVLFERTLQPAKFYTERQFATSTYRRFSNITELSMVSEARKSYKFDYIFVPHNEAEAIDVENIIASFRKWSYPVVANYPERTYPQNLWVIQVTPGSGLQNTFENLSEIWLGEPLPCVLENVTVKRNDKSDPVVRLLPNGSSSYTLLSLIFTEFETGTFVPQANYLYSKSEISARGGIFPS